MIGKLLRGAGRRPNVRPLFAFCTLASLAALILSTAPAAAQAASYFNKGFRWIGTAKTCMAPSEWIAERMFPTSNLPFGLGDFCLYTWSKMGQGVVPTSGDVSRLFSVSQAQNLTEDVPVVFPNTLPSTEEVAFLSGLRAAVRAHVGDASLLPGVPPAPAVRVVVIDSAADAPSGHIVPGASRHGDTLAHLIEDIVCTITSSGRRCAAEVTTVLALPWIERGVLGTNGGYIGTLADLARAIERAVSTWQHDRAKAPSTTPARLLLNLSLGWEDTPGIADCSKTSSIPTSSPAGLVQQALQYAASQGALIIAAAGNDSGGPLPRTGLLCPGRYQAVPRATDPSQALLVAISGVDYQDHPLETARPGGITGIAGLGLGGVAWNSGDPVPPPLTGSSVATAVVSAVGALVWTAQPSWTPGQVTTAVYDGGMDVGAADACPLSIPACRSHRASVCGALQKAGVSSSCLPPTPEAWSSPDLAAEVAALDATYAGVSPSAGTPLIPLSLAAVPRYQAPTVQIDPYVFPSPIATTCRTCVVTAVSGTPGLSSTAPRVDLPPRGQVLSSPVLVVRLADDEVQAMALGPQLAPASSYVFPLPWSLPVQSAYLTGFEASGDSVTEQIFVQQ